MKKIDLVQRSAEWRAFRKTHLGASDASSILGINPWKTKKQLLEQKIYGWEDEISQAMQEGIELESKARLSFEIERGMSFDDMVCESDNFPFIAASLDGISKDLQHAVEIKCGKKSFEMAKDGIIPPYYFSQLQHQLYVTGLGSIYYYAFRETQEITIGITIEVDRDDFFIEEMIEKECKFWNDVLFFTMI